MIAALLLLLAAQVDPPPVATPPPPAPPNDWSTLAVLPLRGPRPDVRALSDYVRDEVKAGRCTATGETLTVHLAVHVAASGQVRRIIPRAIDCPTVEQYASGLMWRMTRHNLPPSATERWYRTALVFSW